MAEIFTISGPPLGGESMYDGFGADAPPPAAPLPPPPPAHRPSTLLAVVGIVGMTILVGVAIHCTVKDG